MTDHQRHFWGISASVVVVFLSVSVFSPLTPPAQATIEIRYEKTIELSQGKEGKLRPVSVTVSPTLGEVAVTEGRNSSVHLLNKAGIETFVTGRFTTLSLPIDAAVDAEGRVVCISKIAGWYNTISRLNIYGEPEAFSPEPPNETWNPDHLTILRDGNYLTVDMDNGFLAKHDSLTGRIIWVGYIGDKTIRDMNFGRPHEMSSGVILVPGGRLSQVFVMSPEGKFLEAFGRFGSAPGRMVFPVGVVGGPDDTILVLDRLRHKILVFDADFVFQTEFGSLGSRPGQFYHPVSMAANDNGSIYVAQGFKGRVQVFNILGNREN